MQSWTCSVFLKKNDIVHACQWGQQGAPVFLISEATFQGHGVAYCLPSQRGLTASLFRWLGLPSKWPGWTEKRNSQMAASLISPLFANIGAAKFTVMQTYLE